MIQLNLPSCQIQLKRTTRLGPQDKSNHLYGPDLLPPPIYDDHDDLMTKKSLDENDVLVHNRRKVPCPLSNSMITLFGCPPKCSRRVPCQSKLISGNSLVLHLSRIHNIRPRTAKPLVKTYQENLVKMLASKDTTVDPATSF